MSLRERKKVEQRERISGVATMLFFERGFDAVSVAEIAERAGVSKMTVFNYFPRKEDLFFDRAPEFTDMIIAAVRGPDAIASLRALWLGLLDERHPLAGFADQMPLFWGVVLGSPALRARVREAIEEIELLIAARLHAAGEDRAEMTAALVVAAMRVRYVDAARRIMAGEPAESFFAEHRAKVEAAFDAAVAAASRG